MQRIALVLALLAGTQAYASDKPGLAIIIDDLGYEMMPRQISLLPEEISISVIPFTEFDTAVALTAYSQQREILLHMPMQSPPGSPDEPGALHSDMSKTEFQNRIKEAIYRVPHAVALNNHMGSVLTSQTVQMDWVMEMLGEYRLGFVDSRTGPATVAEQRARIFGLPASRRHVFLDHEPTPAFIRSQLALAIKLAHKKGAAIAIAHPSDLTINILRQELSSLTKEVDLVPVSAVLHP